MEPVVVGLTAWWSILPPWWGQRRAVRLRHLGFRSCSPSVMPSRGRLVQPPVLADHSQLARHVQGYWHEDSESLFHGRGHVVKYEYNREPHGETGETPL